MNLLNARGLLSALAAGISVAATGAPLSAADLGAGPRYPDAVPPYYAPTWTGFYAGANAGWGWSRVKAEGDDIAVRGDGFVGGLHAGYNHQIRNIVLGVEGDFNWSDVEGRRVLAGPITAETRHRHFGSVRGRFGFAFDRVLAFGTVGYGWTDVRLRGTDGFTAASRTETNGGLVWGGGLEYKLQPNLSIRAEALRYEASGRWRADDGSRVRIDTPATEVRAGLTWHFNTFR